MPRPRSPLAHEKVLQATLALVAEHGVEGTSMDAVAEASGVSKATIYKHWTNKDALCLEALGREKKQLPEVASKDAKRDTVALLSHFAQVRPGESLSRVWPRIVSYSLANPKFGQMLRSCMWTPGRSALADCLRRAIARGQLQSGLDVDSAVDILLGPIIYRRMLGTPIPRSFIEQVVAALWKAHAAPRGRSKS